MSRKKPEMRKEEILEAAMQIALRDGFAAITRNSIAAAVGLSGPAVQYHFSTMGQLRRTLMRRAIRERRLRVIADGLALRDAQALRAPESLRREAMGSVL